MGQTALLPFRIFFFALKNPTASAGFEPAKLGTKGQHATTRPPKPLIAILNRRDYKEHLSVQLIFFYFYLVMKIL